MNKLNRITVLITLCLITTSAACTGETEPRQRRPFLEYWLAVYSGAVQVGCMQTTLSCDTLNGDEVFKRQDNIYLRAKDSDMTVRLDMSNTLHATKRFTPVLDRFIWSANSMASGKSEEHRTEIELDYVNKTQKMVQKSEGETKEEKVEADLDASLDYSAEFYARPLKVGDKLSCQTYKVPSAVKDRGGQVRFERSTSEVRVLRRETIEVDDISYDALVLEDTSNLGKSIRWQLDNGVIVKEDMSYSGVTLKTITEREARAWLDTGGLDFATFLDRVESDKKIAYSNAVTELDVRLIGVSDKVVIPSDNRQKVNYDRKAKTAEYSITAALFDPERSLTLPISDPGMRKWLQPSDGIEVDNETIREKSREIVGEEKNAYHAACRLRKWVSENIKYVDGSKTEMSALSVLQEKQGVCAHMAVLYTTLARAAGIPTYLVVGPSYATDDFRWHAWAESYVGDWVPFDPTRDAHFVDAGHIKMFTGNREIMSDYSIARGELRAEIKRFKYWNPVGDGTKLWWINDKNQWWSTPIDQVCLFRPNGEIVLPNAKIAELMTSEFKVTDGISAIAPNGETFILPADSKILPQGSAYKTPTGYTLQSDNCTIIHTPTGASVLLPPPGKLLQPTLETRR